MTDTTSIPERFQQKQLPRDKIKYLHRMLDNEISTVNSLFEQNSAFEQIQAKLKELQVKLSFIKADDPSIPQLQNSKRPSIGPPQLEILSSNQPSINTAFESLSKFKRENVVNVKSLTKTKNKKMTKNDDSIYSQSGRKLNFDDSFNEEKAKSSIRKKSLNKKAKSENILQKKPRLRTKSHKDQPKSSKKKKQIKSAVKLYSQSHKKISNFQQQPTRISNNSSKSKLSSLKALGNNRIAQIYQKKKLKQKNDKNQRKDRVKKTIKDVTENNLKKELQNVKLQNESLHHKIIELNNYKKEFEKLKTIFEQDSRLEKSRKSFGKNGRVK